MNSSSSGLVEGRLTAEEWAVVISLFQSPRYRFFVEFLRGREQNPPSGRELEREFHSRGLGDVWIAKSEINKIFYRRNLPYRLTFVESNRRAGGWVNKHVQLSRVGSG